MEYFIYDIETYPNCFTFACEQYSTGQQWVFEISFRKDESYNLMQFLTALHNMECVMVGFNNIGFDYPIIHDFIKSGGTIGCLAMYHKCQSIIDSNDRFANTVWQSDWYVPQLDLYKIIQFA